ARGAAARRPGLEQQRNRRGLAYHDAHGQIPSRRRARKTRRPLAHRSCVTRRSQRPRAALTGPSSQSSYRHLEVAARQQLDPHRFAGIRDRLVARILPTSKIELDAGSLDWSEQNDEPAAPLEPPADYSDAREL